MALTNWNITCRKPAAQMFVAMRLPKLQKKVQVSIVSVDMNESKSKIKIMSSEFFQEKKKLYGSARSSASADSFYITTKY